MNLDFLLPKPLFRVTIYLLFIQRTATLLVQYAVFHLKIIKSEKKICAIHKYSQIYENIYLNLLTSL